MPGMGSIMLRKSGHFAGAAVGPRKCDYCLVKLPESTALRLRTQLDCLPTILAGANPAALERHSVPGKWSARENLAHLARYQEAFISRIARIRRESRPTLARYRAEDDSEWPSWINRGVAEIMEALHAQRKTLVRQIETMSDEDLARTAIHPRFGEMTLGQWLEFFLLHEAHHLLAVLQRSRE
jgi:uncharacterized damage-inducible protein DinB